MTRKVICPKCGKLGWRYVRKQRKKLADGSTKILQYEEIIHPACHIGRIREGEEHTN